MAAAPPQRFLGVDLGGSGFRVRRLRVLTRTPLAIELDAADRDDAAAERRWPAGGFAPVALERQLAEHRAGAVSPTAEEEREATARAGLVAEAIEAARRAGGGGPAGVALAAPGIKTPDGRGVAVARNGPRDPRLLERLAAALPANVTVLGALAGDGLAAARGEQVAPGGALRGATFAFFLGGGTGLAEALVMDGRARALDSLAPPLPRAFELGIPLGSETFEARLSVGRLLEHWNRLREQSRVDEWQAVPAPLATPADFCAALDAGDAQAWEVAVAFAGVVRALVADRLHRLTGRLPAAAAGFERLVLGQGYARLFPTAGAASARLLRELGPGARVSTLRAAPAIGALALALDSEPAR